MTNLSNSLYLEARKLWNDGNPTGAKYKYHLSSAADPTNPYPYYDLAKLMEQLGDEDSVVEVRNYLFRYLATGKEKLSNSKEYIEAQQEYQKFRTLEKETYGRIYDWNYGVKNGKPIKINLNSKNDKWIISEKIVDLVGQAHSRRSSRFSFDFVVNSHRRVGKTAPTLDILLATDHRITTFGIALKPTTHDNGLIAYDLIQLAKYSKSIDFVSSYKENDWNNIEILIPKKGHDRFNHQQEIVWRLNDEPFKNAESLSPGATTPILTLYIRVLGLNADFTILGNWPKYGNLYGD